MVVAASVGRRLRAHLRDPVYANGYALVLNAGVGAALGFVFWIVAARLFSREDLGWGAGVISAATLAALIGKAGFDAALIRFVPHVHARYARKIVLYAVAGTVLLTGLVCAAILVLAGSGVPSLAPLRTPLAATGFLLLAAGTSAAWILDAFYIAEQDARVTLLRNLAFHGVKLLAPFAVVAALASFAVPLAWSVGLAASLVVAVALLPRRLRRHTQQGTARPSRREVAAYSAKNYVLNLSEFLPGLVMPIIVLEMLGAEANAGFFLAWTIANVMFLAAKAISQSAFAALVRDASPVPALRKGALLSALVLVPGVIALLLGAPLMFRLFGPEYGGTSVDLLRVLALSAPAIVTLNLYLAYLKARRAGWELTLLPAAMLVTLMVLLPAALAVAGVMGVGYVWLAVQAAAGAYALARLLAALRRNPHERTGTALRRRAHQG